ncbi:MAG: dihydroorotate dehydrogenase electron transfer subunit [Candidatus Lokiarchaeota archaeon]|nr:dihydroorotate dehydrogenase electron transfer subunit [Candidatus Lokiarchaeota archaeon]
MVGKIDKGWKELKAEIVNTDKCCLCGACVNFCDNLVMTPSGPAERGTLCSERTTCRDGQGTCYNSCPYTGSDIIPISLLDRWVHDLPSRDENNEFNHDVLILAARYAGQQPATGFHGGGAEAGLLIAALRAGMIDGVITSHVTSDAPVIVDDEAGILKAARGTPFTNAPLSCIARAIADGYEALALIGSGCEIQALRKMQNHPAVDLEVHDLVSLAIGSFCFFKPKPSKFTTFLGEKGVDLATIDWIGHDKTPFKYDIRAGGTTTIVSLNELYDACAKGSCLSCADGTAGLADISVGVIDAMPGWSVLIVRTARGKQVLKAATQEGLVETRDLNAVLKENVLDVTRNKFFFAPISAIRDEGMDLKTFTFQAPAIAKRYKPGQFVVLWLPDVDFFPMGIAHVLNDDIEITVQRIGEGTSTLFRKHVGDTVGIRGPYGNGWDLSDDDYLVVGGGVGIAGISNALDDLVGRKKRVTAILAGRTSDHVFCEDLYDGKIMQVCIMTDDGSAGAKGLATDPIEQIVKKHGIKHVITCGPEAMMKKVVDIANKLGVPVQASIERKMKCCAGLCGTCCVGENNDVTVCKMGPVFDQDKLARIAGFGSYKKS